MSRVVLVTLTRDDVALVTGRRYDFAMPIAREVDSPLTMIVSNGALVRTFDGETHLRHLLPLDTAARVLQATKPWREGTGVVFDRPRENQVMLEFLETEDPSRQAYYARNKEDLLFELLRRSHEKGLRLCEEHDPALRTSSASIRLAAFIERWMCGIDYRTYHYTGIGLSEVRFLSESRRLEIAGMQKQLTSYVTNIVRQGIAERSFDSTVRPTLVTSSLFSLLNTTHVWFDADNMAWSEISAWYADLFLRRLCSAA